MSEWETFCDVSYYHLWRVRRKTERGFDDGFHLESGEEARDLVELLNRMERERSDAIRQFENLKAAAIHTCHEQCQRPMCVLRRERDELIYISERAIALAEIDFENDKFGVVSELRDGVERIKEGAK